PVTSVFALPVSADGDDGEGDLEMNRWMLIAVTAVVLSGLSLLAQEKKDAPANASDEVRLAREQMQLSREQVALLKIRHAETGAEIERVEHPVLRFTAPL